MIKVAKFLVPITHALITTVGGHGLANMFLIEILFFFEFNDFDFIKIVGLASLIAKAVWVLSFFISSLKLVLTLEVIAFLLMTTAILIMCFNVEISSMVNGFLITSIPFLCCSIYLFYFRYKSLTENKV